MNVSNEAQEPATDALDEQALTDNPATNAEPELPEKYRGKTAAEIAAMHREAERELGRARNEIGTVRRLADELLGINARASQSQQPTPPPRAKLTTDALFDDPEKHITEVVRAEAEERTRAVSERTARLEAELALSRFEKKHPDYLSTMSDEAFTAWVQSSPYRMRLAQAAVSNDFDAADELFSLYKDVKPAQSAAPRENVQAAREASLARSGGAAGGRAAAGAGSKKVWSREELIRMRIDDPDRFDSIYKTEIEPAYREGRVK